MTTVEIHRIDPALPLHEALDMSASGKAFLVTAGKSGMNVWVPMSLASFCNEETHTAVMVPKWFMQAKGF